MGIAAIENAIVTELRFKTGNRKITKSWIQEWSTGDVKAEEGEELHRLDVLGVNVSIKAPEKKTKAKA